MFTSKAMFRLRFYSCTRTSAIEGGFIISIRWRRCRHDICVVNSAVVGAAPVLQCKGQSVVHNCENSKLAPSCVSL
ncbi:hypothetical protein OUZ56_002789 [Daphnia magna]|uniref:Secreted protein n=1 Tax=Daphnia magna TaxID=35525 RepID=A0ABR0A777_9CRUS|nr:hypothetical protein OUZ56_002789 [Daphnia magna]